MVVIIETWITTYRKKANKERWKKDMEQINQLITQEEVRKLDKSETVMWAKSTLKSITASNKTITMKQYTTVRDYLLTYLRLDNGSRTGALANMTMREFDHAKEKKGSFIVGVFEHKTVATSGPAMICFSADIYKESVLFVKNLRTKLE